jgi:oligopeptide transport system permease protein
MISPSAKKLPSADLSPAQLERGVSPWLDAWRRLRRNHLAVFGGITIIVLSLLCVIGPWFSPYSYEETNLNNAFSHPSLHNWLGTDNLGRDLFIRLLYGGRISLMVGLVATFVALTIGVVYGAVSGYVGGKIDRVMMRIVDIMYALPFTIFVILLTVMLDKPVKQLNEWMKNVAVGDWHPLSEFSGAAQIFLLFAAIGAVEWLTMARIVRSQIMSLKRMEFIEAARSLGFSTPRIIFRHMIPNILGPIIVYTTLTIPGVMLLEAFLSFLGLGVQPPMSSWGVLIKDGSQSMEEYPWLLMFPGIVFSLTLFSLNFLGDGLRDALDVRSAKD